MRVSTRDLRAAYDVLWDYLSGREHDPAVERASYWLMRQIETRNIGKVAREHGKSLPEMRLLIAEAEARDNSLGE